MKIQFASDLHLEFRDNWRYLRDNGPMNVKGDILVLAGDTGYLGDDMYSVHPFWNWASENFEQVLVALGNHEFYKYYDLKTMQDGLVGEIRPNVHYYYNKVVTIRDVDFIISTLWAHIDLDNAFYTERSVVDTLSTAVRSLTRYTVCALARASSNSAINLIRARFIEFPKCYCIIGRSLLILPLILELVDFSSKNR